MLRKCVRLRDFFLLYILFLVVFFALHLLNFDIYNFKWHIDENNTEEISIREYESRIIYGLGAEGKATYLTGEEKIMGELSLKSVGMNTILSDRIPLDRPLKDPRHETCKTLHYNIHKKASVIIIFHEEPFSVLLRTVWSVINRSPNNLLKEIILVDDYSKIITALGKKLEHYIETRLKYYPIKLIRTKSHTGLVNARLIGAKAATGDVLVFLDAHCETMIQWLEPLIDRIEKNRTTVAIPIIDVIDESNFKYSTYATNADIFHVGGFEWSGYFTWIDLQKSEKRKMKTPSDPVQSPTMAGGLFAIDRTYFWESGSYDEQMEGWGGENLEMSFRIWQCGGRLEQIPCSRVGHVFKNFQAFGFPNKDTHAINTARLAKVWMGEYADLYFLHQKKYRHSKVVGDLTRRRQLFKRLNCKPFSWYLENVYPEKFVPTKNVKYYGQLKTVDNICCDNLQLTVDKIGPLAAYPCHDYTVPSQLFSISMINELRHENHCAELLPNYKVQLVPCDNENSLQEWVFENGSIKNADMWLCLSAKNVNTTSPLIAEECDTDDKYQKWKFVRNFE